MRLKDKLYEWAVHKNGRVWYEYERYVRENIEEHDSKRLKHLLILFKLNWLFRVQKSTIPYLYPDVPMAQENNRVADGEQAEYIESCADKRVEPYHFVIDLMKYDVISFDIFDTLVLRPFKEPSDLFHIVGHRLQYPTVFVGFKQARINSELEARNRREKQYANREVNLSDIYKEMHIRYGVDEINGRQCEIDTELDYVMPNPYMQLVFKILLSQGKTIVLTSDMYLPQIVLEKIMAKCGYFGYKKMYVSCDYRVNKASGELFNRIKDDFQVEKIVHIGDNLISDIEGAKKAGLDTKYYKNNNEAGKKYRPSWMSELTESVYAGVVNLYLHNGVRRYPFFYEYGFVCGGLYVLGFCNWIKKKAEEKNIEKIIFLSRDGDIYQKVFNKYFGGIPNDYVLWSRFANMKYLIEINQEAFIDRVISQKANGTLDVAIRSVLDSFSINISEDSLREYGLYYDSILTPQNKSAFEHVIRDIWEEITQNYITERDDYAKTIGDILGTAKRIAVIDVGWTASGPEGFKEFVKKYVSSDYEINCWMAGGAGNYGSASGIISNYLDGSLESYMFSPLHNKRNAQIHTNENVAVNNNAVFELFTQAQYPSFEGEKINGRYIFDIPEVENYQIIAQIQKGIMDFIDLYVHIFQKDKYLFNVSGFDAYRPFAEKSFDKSYFENNFLEIVFGYGLSGDYSNQQIETIGQRMKHYYKCCGDR